MTTLQDCPTVGQIVVEHPDSARIFEKLGIDYCCGGKRPFDQVCGEKQLDAATVLRLLDCAPVPSRSDEKDWSNATLSQLCDHIESTHHKYLKDELPRLSQLAQKVAQVHGEKNPAMKRVAEIFEAFKIELTLHMAKEEQILFPLCRMLERSDAMPSFHCGSVQNPIAVMEHEHSDAGDALEQMRKLTDNYTPPDWACNTYRVLLKGLEQLEHDMHSHVHKENNILFPKAVAREKNLIQTAETRIAAN